MADEASRILFTKEMRKTYKLLCPNMADIHFHILQKVFCASGYDVELLTNTDQTVIDEGLKYVHNDICYPALLTIGQMIAAIAITRTLGLLVYLPVMIVISIFTGLFTGLCAQYLVKRGGKLWKTIFK